jgi:peptide methionine sulfoxide reductase msrA/msrB
MANSKAYYAGGCFWGVEHLFQQKEGVISAVSGYMGGSLENPTYQDVLTGRTGHLEAVEITYDPARVTYEELTKFFFEIHDPTQVNGQGPDIGTQYLSAVFYSNQEEKQITQELINILQSKGYNVATKLISAETFWTAEEYHQDYYIKKNQQPYCHVYKKIF